MEPTVPFMHIGGVALVEIGLEDATLTPPFLFDPDTEDGVTLSLQRPDLTFAVTDQVMSKVRTGVYQFVYQTQADFLHGDWLAAVKVQHAGMTDLRKFVAFTLIG